MSDDDARCHAVPLSPGWALWRDCVLRSAGFPAHDALSVADQALAAAADAALRDRRRMPAYQEQYTAATSRLSAAVRGVARSPRFREAVTWQNPKLIRDCVDKAAAGEPRNVRGRNHENTIAAYLQRYCLKNDTIGFFGPVGWARWVDDGPPIGVTVADEPLARRSVHFESWVLDAVAETLAADPAVQPWLVPRLLSAHRLEESTLHVPGRPPVAVAPHDAELLAVVDGVRSVRDIAEETAWSEFPELADEDAVLTACRSLADRGLLQLDLLGTIETWPERALLRRLAAIGDPGVREAAVGTVRHLVDGRDRVSASAGDDAALLTALTDLDERFREVTGSSAERRSGKTYAGRKLVYEDTLLGTRVRLGPALRAELGHPLHLLLLGARWLVAEAAEEYRGVFDAAYDRRVGQLGGPDVPLAGIMSLTTRDLHFSLRGLADPVQRVGAEFRRRWERILQVPPGAREVRLASGDIADRVAAAFPARVAPWAAGVHHAPDVMLAADGVEAVERGDYLLVLGELHVSVNTLESRVFVEHHDDPPSMLAAAEADLGDRRVYAIPAKHWPGVSSRLSPPSSLLSPRYTYWTAHPESVTPPAPVIPGADLVVRREDGQLVVRTRSGGFRAPLLEVFGELLSAAVVNSFRPVAGTHSPRVAIDKLVVAREAWRLPASEVDWARARSEEARFLGAREWRQAVGLPERAYYTVPVEDKPTFVDFRSIVYVNLLAKAIRRTVDGPGGSLSLTEMLPDLSQLWLTDAAGRRYTAEFRMLAVDEWSRQAAARA